MKIDFTGKIALVTGGTRGIGRAIVQALADGGASVAFTYRSSTEEAQSFRAELEARGCPVLTHQGDAGDSEAASEAVAMVLEAWGRIDILVNNAGGSGGFAPVSQLSDDAWQEAAAWILHSTFWATRAALRDMEPRAWGRILNISSVEGRQANKENVSHYITFKHAMNGFTKAVAFESGAKGITSNAISPGAVETDLMKQAGPEAAESMGISYDEFKNNYAQDAAIKRLNTIDEVAGMALFLCSDLGAGITGSILPVDGGTAL